jgi:hypothetical protein
LAAAGTALAATTETGPSTTTDPYVLPVADGVKVISLHRGDADRSRRRLERLPDGGHPERPGRHRRPKRARLHAVHEPRASPYPEPDKAEPGQLLTLEVRDWKKVFDE